MALDLESVLRMRVSGEQARTTDLARLLPYAAAGDESRRTGLADRIAERTSWAAGLPDRKDGWTAWNESIELGDADLLVDELVALLMTRLLRLQGLDVGTFDAAEAFVCELVERAGVPGLVLGHTQELESIDHTRASVTLRFPGSRVWDLPFLGHEFGHHAVVQLRHIEPILVDNRPLNDVAAAVAKTLAGAGERAGRARAHADELVADAIATVCCGPSYVAACLCLRAPVHASAWQATESHPAWADRIATMRSVLDALTDKTKLPRFHYQRVTLVDPLAEAVLGRVPTTSAAAADAGEGTVADIVRHRPGLVYRAADVGIDVADRLKRRDPGPPAGTTVTAAIDGAWRWRLDRELPDDDDAVAALVVDYCRAISSGGTR